MPAALLLLWALVVSIWDLKARRIPNLLLLPVAICASLALIVTGQSLLGATWMSALFGALVGAAPWMAGYALGRGGAGDVKYAALLGLVVGGDAALTGTLISMLLFGAASVILVRAGWRGIRIPLAPVITLGFTIGYAYQVSGEAGWRLMGG